MKPSAVRWPQPMVPTPGIRPDPVGGEDEDEDRAEEPERPLHQVRPDDAFEQVVEAFDQPLEKVLRAAGHLRHPARRELREDDEADGDDPRDDHRVGDRKTEGPAISTAFCGSPCSTGCRQREEDRGEGAHAATSTEHGACHG